MGGPVKDAALNATRGPTEPHRAPLRGGKLFTG